VVQDYKRRELMLVEEKTRGGRLHYGQQQTFKLLDNIVRWACSHPQSKTKYRGFHVVRFAGTTPENSNWIEIDGKRVTRDQVVEFMNLEFDSKD